MRGEPFHFRPAEVRDIVRLTHALHEAPRDPAARGAHVSLRHAHAWEVMQALVEDGVVGDVRPPDLLRFGFAPLDVSLADVDEAFDRLGRVLEIGSWRGWLDAARPTVT